MLTTVSFVFLLFLGFSSADFIDGPCTYRVDGSTAFTWKSTGVFFFYPNQGITPLPGNFPVQIPVTYNYYADFPNGLTRSDYLDRDGELISLFQDYSTLTIYNVSKGVCKTVPLIPPAVTDLFQVREMNLVGNNRAISYWRNETAAFNAIWQVLTSDGCIPITFTNYLKGDSSRIHNTWWISDYSDHVNPNLMVIPDICF